MCGFTLAIFGFDLAFDSADHTRETQVKVISPVWLGWIEHEDGAVDWSAAYKDERSGKLPAEARKLPCASTGERAPALVC